MTESINNKSFTPLLAGRVYIGTYDSVAPYATATISLLTDTACQLVAYQSQNKIQQNVTSYNTVGGVQFTQQLDLTEPFVYFTVRNSSGTDGTLMAFTVIYRTNQVLPPVVRGSQNLIGVDGFTTVNLSRQAVKTLTIFGETSAPTVLSVKFSNDGTNFFQSQYQYSVTGVAGGAFGFSINACPYYLRLDSTVTDAVQSAFLNYA